MELQGNCGGNCCLSPALRRWTLDEGERCSYIFWVLTLSCPSARHNWHNSCQDFVPAGNRGREQGQLEEEPAGSRFCSPTATLPANLLYPTWDIPYLQTSTSNPNTFISSFPPKNPTITTCSLTILNQDLLDLFPKALRKGIFSHTWKVWTLTAYKLTAEFKSCNMLLLVLTDLCNGFSLCCFQWEISAGNKEAHLTNKGEDC